MDLNPTFGRQELFETLSSQGSRTSSSRNNGSQRSSTHPQQKQSHPDEAAVRLLGHKLSLQAHEGTSSVNSIIVQEIGWNPGSCFEAYRKNTDEPPPVRRKVAKLQLTDHGDHHHHHEASNTILEDEEDAMDHQKEQVDVPLHPRRITQSLTVQCKQVYDVLTNHCLRSCNSLRNTISWKQQQRCRRGGPPVKGLLASVMENTSCPSEKDSSSRTTQSISTKDDTRNSQNPNLPPLPQGKCLTVPSDGTCNDGEDNDDGNLIVFENDTIGVNRKTLKLVDDSVKARSADFRILSLQGHGTFAQVFQCLHLQTNNLVALKIIKNKLAYTRQAAIEIEIYQTLREQQQTADYMVHLHAYFMHKNHLCLVFELLGMNLYEILKKRQFRGLSVSMVQNMMRQSMVGIRELALKNVVHCDLKPENILVVSDEVSRRVIQQQTGSSKTSSTSSDQSSSRTYTSGQDSQTQNEGSHESSGQPTSSKGISSSSSSTMMAFNNDHNAVKIKLIDFGSACFEGLTAHSYIQSRFYRSPEVLLGLPYDSSIDMWSLGCIAAELFLGLPILPGMHEHDQMTRITEMIAPIPEWMLEQGSKATKCYVKYFPRNALPLQQSTHGSSSSNSSLQPKWRLKTQNEYVVALSQSEVRRRGGIEKLNRPNNSRYFKREKLSEIIYLHAQHIRGTDRNLVRSFVHFLYCLLDPDPWKRLTAFQAMQHPFITGELEQLLPAAARPKDLNVKEENQANLQLDSYWKPPWDPSICRRKLLSVQKLRETQNSHRRARAPSRSEVDQPSIMSRTSIETTVSTSGSNSTQYHTMFPGGLSQPINASELGRAPQQNGQFDSYSYNGYSSIASSSQGFGHTGHAIERPGVVPCNYSVSTSNSQSVGYGGSVPSGSFVQYSQTMMPDPTMHNRRNTQQGHSGYTGLSAGGNQTFVSEDNNSRQNHQFLDHVSVRSTSSTISDATMITDTQYQMFLAQQQQQQQFILAQQHQQFILAQQQQQQQQQFSALRTGFQQQQTFIPPGQRQMMSQVPLQPGQHPMVQQVAMPGNGGGAYFYMVNQASGQPILLQPVGFAAQPQTGAQPFVMPQGQQFTPTGQRQEVDPTRQHFPSSRSTQGRTSRGGMSM